MDVDGLVTAYRDTIRRYYGTYAPPPKYAATTDGHQRGMELLMQLAEFDIDTTAYVEEVVSVWKPWFSKGLGIAVPYAFVLSDKAWLRFMDTAAHSTVRLPDVNDDLCDNLIYCETMVLAKWLDCRIHGDPQRMDDVVAMMRDLLTDEWLMLYSSGGSRTALQSEAIERMSKMHGVPDTSPNYGALLSKILHSRRANAATDPISTDYSVGTLIGGDATGVLMAGYPYER